MTARHGVFCPVGGTSDVSLFSFLPRKLAGMGKVFYDRTCLLSALFRSVEAW